MLRHRLFVFFIALSLPLAGCDDDGDGGTDAGPDIDAGEPGGLFDACNSDADCGNEAVCRTSADGFPGGYCTRACTDRTPCDDGFVYNHCLARGEDTEAQFCELRCLNGIDCGRDGWTCQAGIFPDDSGACIPVCSSDEQCGNGAMCNRYTGECSLESISPSGSIAGEACADNDGCRSGICNPEISDQTGNPTGWVGGYCLGYCILPSGYNTNTFYEGDALPSGSCPDDDICFPASFGAASQRDLGFCLDSCTTDGECREGYFCRSQFAIGMSTASFTNGVCWPADCTMNGCPTGYECTMVGDGAVCAPL